MKKHIILLLLVLCMVLALTVPVFAADPSLSETIVNHSILLAVNSPLAYVQGEKFSVDSNNPAVMPLIVNNRTLVPVRFIGESLGMDVGWTQATRTASISGLGRDIRITLDSKTMYVNGKAVTLDVPATYREGRTLVPVRAITEALDQKVYYYNNLIVIGDGSYTLDVSDKDTKALLDQLREELFHKFKITYAGQVGEINGVTYAIRDVPGMTTLPVGAAYFCYYDGYVYYSKRDRAGTSDYNTALFRCKSNWTGEQKLADNVSNFLIDDGVLYNNVISINLSTLEVKNAKQPTYSVKINNTTYKSTSRTYSMGIYNDVYVVYLSSSKKLYTVVNDTATQVLSGVRASVVGTAGGYLYYSTEEPSKDPNYAGFADGCLYRVPLTGGTPVLIDRHVTAGSGGYFNY